MNNRLSIIIPHYNSSNLLLKLLETIPEKEDIEIIIIDDKSLNYHQKIIKEHIKNRKNTKYLYGHGKGAGNARNIGLENATGKWIVFADADDFFLPKAFNIFMKYMDSSYDIIHFLVTSIRLEDGKVGSRHLEHNRIVRSLARNEKNSREWIILNFNPWGKMIKKSLIDKYSLKFEEVIAANDAFFSVKSNFFAKRIFAVQEEVYCVTANSNSITANINEKKFDSIFQQYLLIDKFLTKNKKYKIRPTFFRQLFNARKFGAKKVYSAYKMIKKEKCLYFTLELWRKLTFRSLYIILKRKFY